MFSTYNAYVHAMFHPRRYDSPCHLVVDRRMMAHRMRGRCIRALRGDFRCYTYRLSFRAIPPAINIARPTRENAIIKQINVNFLSANRQLFLQNLILLKLGIVAARTPLIQRKLTYDAEHFFFTFNRLDSDSGMEFSCCGVFYSLTLPPGQYCLRPKSYTSTATPLHVNLNERHIHEFRLLLLSSSHAIPTPVQVRTLH